MGLWEGLGLGCLSILPGTLSSLACHLRSLSEAELVTGRVMHLVCQDRGKPRYTGQWPGPGWFLEPGCGLDPSQDG